MSEPLRCPYCRSELSSDEAARCLSCKTGHHRICIAAHGRCTILGCESRAVIIAGDRFHVDELADELDFNAIPFRCSDGLPDQEPRFLRVDPPEDESEPRPKKLSLELELDNEQVRRGSRVTGAVSILSPRSLFLRQGHLKLITLVETTKNPSAGRRTTRRKTRVIERDVVFAGQRSISAGSRVVDGVLSLLGRPGERLIKMPAGRRRYDFSFPVDLAFAASVHHSRGEEEDRVSTLVTATVSIPLVSTLSASQDLTIL